MTAGKVFAPFTPGQVESINNFQNEGRFHEFTCPSSDDHTLGRVLVATEEGLQCPSCDYRQFWVHEFMANGQWQERGAAR